MNSSNVIIIDSSYDPIGAGFYILVTLCWYSLGMICMLAMQIKFPDETIDDCTRRRERVLLETLSHQTHTKQILEELADKVKRDKLWDIYLGESDPNVSNEKLMQAEVLRIRHIEKQLAEINQNHRVLQENLVSDSFQLSSQSIFESTRENRFRVRRRSSFDQQIIEQWKRFGEQCKNHEQLPWTIQKHIIRRHFRRRQKELLREFEQINAYINNSK